MTVMCALWRRVKVMLNCFGSSHVVTPVSQQCLKSPTFSLSRLVSKSKMSRLVSIPLSWPMSLSQKKCLDSITGTFPKSKSGRGFPKWEPLKEQYFPHASSLHPTNSVKNSKCWNTALGKSIIYNEFSVLDKPVNKCECLTRLSQHCRRTESIEIQTEAESA